MDPIADMLSQIKNANSAGKPSVALPYSKLSMSIASTLAKEGYVVEADHKGSQPTKVIEVSLAYDENGKPKIQGMKRVSKTSRRVYEKASALGSVRHGYGAKVVSTPRGIMTDREAREANVGGEVLFEIW